MTILSPETEGYDM